MHSWQETDEELRTNSPAPHAEHVSSPAVENLPSGQSTQLEAAVTGPYVPASQFVQVLAPLEAYVPAWQSEQLEAPTKLLLPGTQLTHVDEAFTAPTFSPEVPAAQPMQNGAPASVWY